MYRQTTLHSVNAFLKPITSMPGLKLVQGLCLQEPRYNLETSRMRHWRRHHREQPSAVHAPQTTNPISLRAFPPDTVNQTNARTLHATQPFLDRVKYTVELPWMKKESAFCAQKYLLLTALIGDGQPCTARCYCLSETNESDSIQLCAPAPLGP